MACVMWAPMEARRSIQSSATKVPVSWEPLGTELRPSGRAASALNHLPSHQNFRVRTVIEAWTFSWFRFHYKKKDSKILKTQIYQIN